MNSTILLAMSLGPSLVAVGLLAWRDPKRLRNAQRGGAAPRRPWSGVQRRTLAAVVLVPGAGLLLCSAWAAFLIWMGATTAIGWGWASALAPAAKTLRPDSIANAIHSQ